MEYKQQDSDHGNYTWQTIQFHQPIRKDVGKEKEINNKKIENF